MISGICKAEGKHPKGKEETWEYFTPNDAIPNWNGDECARLKYGFVKVDIDDYDKRGVPIHIIKGEKCSDVVKRILDNHGMKYNLLQTERGVHFYFRLPEGSFDSKKINWQTSIALEIEYHPGEGTAKTHIPYIVNGKARKWLVGNMTNEDIDPIPFWLYPMQKSAHTGFDLNFQKGNRTQNLGAYLFCLVNKGFPAKQAFEVVRLMNEHVFEDPIPSSTLEAEILNDSTMEKLLTNQKEKNDKNISHAEIAQEIIYDFDIITVNGSFFYYDGGLYKPFDESKITEYMTTYHPKLNGNYEKEVIRQIKGRTLTAYPEDNGTVNVKNGVLHFSDAGEVSFLPHSKENISFRQFNAAYNPEASSQLLNDTLSTWFNGSLEQIELFNQMLGYLLMNHVRYQKIFFFIGAPATGKSTLLDLITTFCGEENVSAIQFEDMNRTFGLASIVNKTANIFADCRKTKVFATEIFNTLADGGKLKINQKYRQEFEYRYTGKLIFGMNNFPSFENMDGVTRRLIIFKFKRVFKQGDPNYNPNLHGELSSEECMSALLNQALKGYKTLIANKGFCVTKESESALNDFIHENDNVARWLHESDIEENYLLREPIKNGIHGLYPEYCAYCINIGEEAKAQKDFSRKMNQLYGFTTKVRRVNGVKMPFFSRM